MNIGKAKMSHTGAIKATGFEDHLSEFVMKLETGPRKNQHVKVRGHTNTRSINSPNLLSLLHSYCDRKVKM